MMLSRIEPGPAHSDFLTFECPKCEHVQKMVVGDPMKAVNTGWTAGGLQPPE
jgi:ribosomal protein S27E